ncbi:hypothetical protein HMPREF9374_3631 [Desmospora sp. 8437]|nr:hypothetical protein HMPREF9374_3631 [Desmospora sp. 8437]
MDAPPSDVKGFCGESGGRRPGMAVAIHPAGSGRLYSIMKTGG